MLWRPVVLWRSVVRRTMVVVRIVWLVVMVMIMVVRIRRVAAPTPIVWAVPAIVPIPTIRTAPIVVRIVPAVVPTIRRYYGCAPSTKHRSYILWLGPHHIARNYDVVECRVVCRGVVERIGVAPSVVRRRHIVGWRRETIQATCVCALVAVGQNSIVTIEGALVTHDDSLLCSLGISLRQCCLVLSALRLILSSLRLVLCLSEFGLSLLSLGDSYLVVYRVQIVRICYILPHRSATR